MMKKNLNLAVTLSILLLFASCSVSKTLPPSTIEDHLIIYNVQKTVKNDGLEAQFTYMTQLNDNGTYTNKVNGKVQDAGEYSYQVIDKRRAKIIFRYSSKDGIKIYTVTHVFATPTNGTWESFYAGDTGGAEAGTFKFAHSGKTTGEKG